MASEDNAATMTEPPAQLGGELERRNSNDVALARLRHRGGPKPRVVHLLTELVQTTAHVLRVDEVGAFQHDPDQGAFVCRAWAKEGGEQQSPRGGKIATDSPLGRAIVSAEPCLVHRASSEDGLRTLHSSGRPIASCAAAPIVAGGRVFGVLAAFSERPCAFVEEDLVFLETAADVIGCRVATACVLSTSSACLAREMADAAADLGHDVANALTVVQICARWIRAAQSQETMREHARRIEDVAQHVSTVARELNELGRVGSAPPRVIDLSCEVREAAGLLRHVLGERVQLVERLCTEALGVIVPRGDLERVLVNAVSNSRDSMPSGGTLWIETRKISGGCMAARDGEGPSRGAWALLHIADTGCGMQRHAAERAFAPGFTTKGGRGHGYGLSAVRRIVERAGGRVDIETTPGEGTLLAVYLPLSGAPSCGDPGR